MLTNNSFVFPRIFYTWKREQKIQTKPYFLNYELVYVHHWDGRQTIYFGIPTQEIAYVSSDVQLTPKNVSVEYEISPLQRRNHESKRWSFTAVCLDKDFRKSLSHNGARFYWDLCLSFQSQYLHSARITIHPRHGMF